MRFLIPALLLAAALAPAQELKPIALPKPQIDGGKPLMQALAQRHSTREYSEQKLSPQMLSNLLWAANGISRPDGKRTAPSAMNKQPIDIYVALAEGMFLYNAKANQLEPVLSEDVRKATGGQPFVATAALNLVYVADQAKSKGYEQADAAFIAENVYLFCASEDLAVVVRALVDRPALAKIMKLRPDQMIVLAQTVGYPKK